MRFLFVDKITKCDAHVIEGEHLFGELDPFRCQSPSGDPCIATCAVSEAIGQLASWLCIERSGFTAKPVFLLADLIETRSLVPPGSRVRLTGHVDHMTDDGLIRFSGEASLDGRVVQTVRECYGHLMPLATLDDPDVIKRRFETLTSGGAEPAADAEAPYRFAGLVDEVLQLTPRRMVVTTTRLKPDEPFYKDHFPRRPVTPIVMLSEMIHTAAEQLAPDDAPTLSPRLKAVRDLKIRCFVRPGDRCVAVLTADPKAPPGSLRTTAEIQVNGKRIMRGHYEYAVNA